MTDFSDCAPLESSGFQPLATLDRMISLSTTTPMLNCLGSAAYKAGIAYQDIEADNLKHPDNLSVKYWSLAFSDLIYAGFKTLAVRVSATQPPTASLTRDGASLIVNDAVMSFSPAPYNASNELFTFGVTATVGFNLTPTPNQGKLSQWTAEVTATGFHATFLNTSDMAGQYASGNAHTMEIGLRNILEAAGNAYFAHHPPNVDAMSEITLADETIVYGDGVVEYGTNVQFHFQ